MENGKMEAQTTFIVCDYADADTEAKNGFRWRMEEWSNEQPSHKGFLLCVWVGKCRWRGKMVHIGIPVNSGRG
jgi:hypothetical protein